MNAARFLYFGTNGAATESSPAGSGVNVPFYADVLAAGVAAGSYPVYFSMPYRMIGWPVAAGVLYPFTGMLNQTFDQRSGKSGSANLRPNIHAPQYALVRLFGSFQGKKPDDPQ